MKTEPFDKNHAYSDSDLSVSAIFGLLLDQRRRYMLYYLSRKVGAVSIEDVAEQVALWEGTPTRNRLERICTGLHHNHLPRLIDANVVRYDRDAGTIELLDAASQLEPFLELAMADDVASGGDVRSNV